MLINLLIKVLRFIRRLVYITPAEIQERKIRQEKLRTCDNGYHKWGKWQRGTLTTTFDYGVKGKETIQIRRCLDCNFEQSEKVWD